MRGDEMSRRKLRPVVSGIWGTDQTGIVGAIPLNPDETTKG